MRSCLCILVPALLLAGCTTSPRDLEREADLAVTSGTAWVVTSAVCVISPTGAGGDVRGVVTFERVADEIVRITADVSGLTPGARHGFHIHEFGDLTARDASSAGSHYAPQDQRHGAPSDPHSHAGDLGNLVANDQGEAHLVLSVHGFSLSEEHPVLGRAVIVHAQADDLRSQPSGSSGARVGAGVIGVAKP